MAEQVEQLLQEVRAALASDDVAGLRRCLTAARRADVAEVMELLEDEEQVANLFRKYDLTAVPVIDDQDRLLGHVTHDDVMDVADEEAEEDLLRMAGTDPRELDSASPVQAVRVRASWPAACMIGTVVTMGVAAFFKGELHVEIFAVLAIFGPSIATMSGNSGVQTATLTVRGLPASSLAGRSTRRAYARELRVAGALAVLFGVMAAIVVRLLVPVLERTGRLGQEVSPALVAWAVGGAMLLTILYATTLGIILPFAMRRFGVDPAIASGPLVTTLNDSASWAIYLVLATSLLRMGI